MTYCVSKYLHLTSSFEFIDSSEHGPLAMLQPRSALRKESSETYLWEF